ncbi:uncharacterized protein AKAME5_000999000 [Lates japonicus]|uniref:Uncharacterized protein n=1 Tax=Lates japonicus TaxID=270547 RepID=A0AAD3MQM3_LATJO|nr:uncharacterized protein AKAME5_000999000 [Lates japonicus]
MSVDSDNSCVCCHHELRTSCVFQTADEKDDLGSGRERPGVLRATQVPDLEGSSCACPSCTAAQVLDSTRTSSASSSSSNSLPSHASTTPPIPHRSPSSFLLPSLQLRRSTPAAGQEAEHTAQVASVVIMSKG